MNKQIKGFKLIRREKLTKDMRGGASIKAANLMPLIERPKGVSRSDFDEREMQVPAKPVETVSALE